MGSRTETNHYLKFELIEQKPKTTVYLISSVASNESLGHVYWHNAWRRYAFFPLENTTFDSSCLTVIRDFINALMKKRKEES